MYLVFSMVPFIGLSAFALTLDKSLSTSLLQRSLNVSYSVASMFTMHSYPYCLAIANIADLSNGKYVSLRCSYLKSHAE